MLWLPRYFRYSIEAKRVKSKGTGSDRSFTGMFTCMLSVLQSFKESKEKKRMNEKRSMVKYEEVGNIEKNVFVVFDIFLKQSEKKENSWLLTTNDSTNMLTS